CSPQTRSRKLPDTAKFECFIWRFALIEKTSWLLRVNSKSAESNSNSKTTRSRTQFTSAIPTGTSSRSQRTTWLVRQSRRYSDCLFTIKRNAFALYSLPPQSRKSHNYLVAEYRKSEKCNRHNMKTITLKPLVVCLAVAGLGQIASAQNDLNLPDVSQAAEVKQRIALTDIAIKYHRPLVNGRKIWGGLVPYGKVWRAGANENTTIEF